ncbi:conserved hypothetical protein (plasmid) [Nitrobacter hamburgensis X14]|jgi:hypothetical protein|uniref:DUF2171 domain-containing protein n=1 Tax=Nitrobacter hamburgensis (strain DSM 10229 / NCIMB 13809 / X14) TaxID=323097 RepID=Q1QG65_NITHX|nr:DUF2171 domain-containing protein [Nitrobacter hamburgensis]ABE64782.1 conserved hypothetical protein [Nitrobacter hamburgensis X14]
MISAEQVREHMVVVASDGETIGKVDHIEGANKIKLTKGDSPDGKHHFIPLDWVENVDDRIHLGKAAKDVRAQWN